MYTVFRVGSESEDKDIASIVKEVKVSPVDSFEKAKKSNVFSCSICESSDWSEQNEKIVSFVQENKEFFGKYNDLYFCFDIAVEHEDLEDKIIHSLLLDKSLIEQLYKNNILFEISIYVS